MSLAEIKKGDRAVERIGQTAVLATIPERIAREVTSDM
jgi:hypothetical protein